MWGGITQQGRSLDKWSPVLFLVAGVLFSGFVVVNVITRFTDMTGVWLGVAEIGTGLFGLLVSIVAVLGLYPRLNDRTPRLSGAGVLAFAAAILGLAVGVAWLLSIGIENAPEAVPTALTALFSLSILLIAGGFLVFAVACLRTGTPSRLVGYLLLLAVVMWVWHYIALALFGSTRIGTIIDYTVIAAAYLAVGYLLRTEADPAHHAESTPDSPA